MKPTPSRTLTFFPGFPGIAGSRPARYRVGATLPELALYLLVLGVSAQILIIPFRAQVDQLAVNAAREEVVALLHRARQEARATGEAIVVIEEEGDPVLLGSGEAPSTRVPLGDRGMRLEIFGPRHTADVRYGPLGVAQFAAVSFVIRRGRAEAPVVISGYGRVRR